MPPRHWQLLLDLRLRGAQRMVNILRTLGNRRFTLLAYMSLASTMISLVTGLGFFLLVLSFNQPEPVSWWHMTVIYAVAWTIGFLVFITPAGLGPREAALTLFLAPVYGPETAFSIALVARLWWALAEGLHIGIALLGVGQRQLSLHRDQAG
jgi:uncharacterized membrane protein YbhN (UPF0104 family)